MTGRAARDSRRWLGGLLVAAAVACSDPVDPATVDLTGRWEGRPGELGIATLSLDLQEQTGGAVTGSGSYTSNSATLPNGTVNVQGIHLAGEVILTITFHTGTQDVTRVFNGGIDNADRFHLIFAGTQGAIRVNFDRTS